MTSCFSCLRKLSFLPYFMFVMAAVLMPQHQAQAAITYVASASNPSDGTSLDTTVVAVTPPGSMQVGDLVIMLANSREAAQALAISATGGQTWTSETANSTNSTQRIFWARYNGTWSANPSVSFPSLANGTTVSLHVFRPSATVNTWAVDVALSGASFSAPASPYDVTATGITTLTDGALVFATWVSTDNNTWALQTAGWTNAGNAQYRNGDGSDNSQSSAYKVMATAGASGNVTNRQATLGGDAGNRSIMAFKEIPVTTLASGSDPAATTIAPGAAATDVDQFTLQTSSGTETITSVTVNLSSNSGVGRLAITNSGGTELGFTTSPATGPNVITVSGMSASTSLTTFKVQVTPLSHSAMPAVPGATYTVTAPVTAWVGPNTHTGSDTNTVALSIDNTSPSGATATSGSAGNQQVTLNWTTSASSDFSRSVVLRWASGSAGADVPAEGTDYTNGTAIGGATVACVRTADAASTAVSGVDGAGTGNCSATTLTGAQSYSYKVFQKDSRGNYDAGVSIGAFTPFSTTTIATGTDPAASTIAPGTAATDVNQFTLQTASGTEAITSVTVNLSTNSGVGRLAITDNAGTELGFTTSPATGSNTITVAGMTASTTLTTFKVRVTPLLHGAMPAVPGGAYAITAPVTAWAGGNAHAGSDTNANALTIDNASPTGATAVSGTAGSAKVTLNWTSSSSTDFATTAGSVVYRWAAASAGGEVPTEGSTPILGSTNTTATVACLVNSATTTALTRTDGTGGSADCTNAALTSGQAYTYKVFQKDSNGNYDAGVAIGTFIPPTTTLGDGTNPSNVTVAPSSAIVDLDSFTLSTNSGTDSVTALTVTLAGVNSFQALSEVRITSSDGATTYFAAVANPASNTVSFSGGTPIPVTTSTTTFKVRITPKAHGNMLLPPGFAYSVGGTVTAFTSSNGQAGIDSTSATVTVDNLSPASATAASISAGNAKTTLNWTSSSSGDFATTAGSVVYRWTSASAGSEVPAEGSTPTIGATNTTATVACVVNSAPSTSLIRADGTGGSSDCTNVALTNGQSYTYKVFQKDTNGNYDVGTTMGTISPNVTTLGDGINPSNTTLAPSATIVDLDSFTLQAASGSDSVTGLTVILTGTNSYQGLSEVRITNSAGTTTYFSAVTNPSSNTISFSGGTPIPVTTTPTTFKIRITPLTHPNMPVPPGATYVIGGTIASFSSTNAQVLGDTGSAIVTIDNASPASATATSGSAGNTKTTLNWTSSISSDFATTAGSVVYRWASSSAGSQVPAEGSTPTVGSINGTATVACVVNSSSATALTKVDGTGGSADCSNNALTNGQAYSYKVFQKDSNGNYDVGVSIGTLTPNLTTLGDGANPSNANLLPGGAITDLNAFTLQAGSGTDSVTALTVTLSGANSYQGLSEVRITNSAGTTTYFTAVTNPTSNTISFSGGTPIPVTTTSTTFKVRITPYTHPNMPVPPGATYSVGGTVTAFTSTNPQSGTDSGSATITIDNASPASATATSGSAGTAKVTLNWTTSTSADFATTAGSVVYRWASATAGNEVPAEGSTPTVNSTNGTATVACVVNSSASTALTKVDGTGGSADCASTALSSGQAYTYKIFQKDSSGNYDVGANLATVTLATACVTQASGSWSTPGTWTSCRNNVPLAGDTVTVNHAVALDLVTPALASLTIGVSGGITYAAGGTLSLAGNLTNNGSLSLGTAGNIVLTADSQWTGSGATWSFNNLDLGGHVLGFGVADAYTLAINGAISNVGSLNTASPNSAMTFQFGGAAQALPVTNVIYPSVIVSGSGAKTLSGAGTFDVRGSFKLNGASDTPAGSATFAAGINNVDLYGDFTNNGGANFNPGSSDSGTWTLKGVVTQNLNSTGISTTFPNLVLNNANGFALNASAMIKTKLTLTNGNISTGTNILTLLANCTDVGATATNGTSWQRASATLFVAGNVRLTFPANATTTCTYPVGSGTNPAPIGLTATTTGGGWLTGSTTGSEQPQIASSSIDPTRDVNRYWSLWTTGDNVAISSYSATFNFVSGDLDITATPTSFVVGKYVSGIWSLPTGVTASATATGIAGASGPIAAATDFAAGQIPDVCAPSSDVATWAASQSPAVTLSCVCDNFGRTSLNPSTIYGQNWIVGHRSGNFLDPRIVNSGYLRLTDASTLVSTVANVPSTFPAAGNVIFVEFKHYAYNGSGADGIALTLSDATETPTPGAFGGSLGYAQKCQNGQNYSPYGATCSSDCTVSGGCGGFIGGWVGIALDEYGNYSTNSQGTLGAATQDVRVPDSIGVRGSWGCANGTSAQKAQCMTGYSFLKSSGTLSTGIDAAATSAAPGYAYRITVDARNYASNHTFVEVKRDTSGVLSASSPTVIPSFDVFLQNPSQSVVPQNWKLSFTGSTGAATNIHEISGLKICAQTITPPAGYLIQVDNYSPSSCGTAGGSPAAPVVTIKAVDSGGNVITNYSNTVTLAAKQAGNANSAGVWSKVTGSATGALSASTGTGSQTYKFETADAGIARFYLVDASSQDIYLTVTESGGSPATSLATAIQYRGGSFSVTASDPLGTTLVAGRPHKMTIARTTCSGGSSSTDSSYGGIKALDGWYDPVVGDHPSGAIAPQICPLNGTVCQPTAGTPCVVLSINAPVLSATSNDLSLNFTSGVANFCLSTADVGKYSIGIRDDSTVSSPILGASPTLTARPFGVAVTNVLQGTIQNPADNTATGSTTLVAGTPFQATVGGYLWNSAGDIYDNATGLLKTGGDGLPDSAATFAGVTGSGLAPHFSDTITLWAVQPYEPSGGTLGTLINGSATILSNSGGYATPNTLRYDEVGSFSLSAIPSANYLNSSVNLLDRVVIFANPGSSSRTSVVGRFRPQKILVAPTATPVLASACASGGFTYMGQEIGFSTVPVLQLTAVAATGTTTNNYGGSYWKLASTLAARSYTSTTGTVTRTTDGGNAALAGDTNYDGQGTLTISGDRLTYTRPAAPIAEFSTNVDLTIPAASLTDSDGVCYWAAGSTCTALSMTGIGSGKQRFGILKIDNASGSERQNLPVKVSAMYYAGSPAGWAVNTLDGCTTLPVAPFTAQSASTTADACYTAACTSNSGGATNSVWLHDIGGTAIAKAAAPSASSGTTLTTGLGTGTVTLTAPVVGGAPAPGTLEFTLVAPSWLKSNSGKNGTTNNYDWNPTGRITLGVYGPTTNKTKFIYIRENY